MKIEHKFLNHHWGNGFWSENSILKSDHYKPEVLFIGTFNPNVPWNNADFYYGRGMYMWPILANLFLHNFNKLSEQRTHKNNNPTLDDIFRICKLGKISFAEIISGTKIEIPIKIDGKIIEVNSEYIWFDYKDKPLNYMGNKNWLDTNTLAICDYLNENPTIKFVYYTFKDGGDWINSQVSYIQNNNISAHHSSIFTPTCNGFRKNLDFPFDKRAWSLTHSWIWNGLQHKTPINKINYGNLNHNWLRKNGVNIKLF